MDSLHEHTIPWHLLGGAFLGQLTPAEEQELQAWLAQDPANQDVFDRLKNTWENDLDDYALYLQADENAAWQKFRKQLPEEEERPRGIIRPMRRWIAAAAAVVLLAGAGWWLLMQSGKGAIYQTAQHEYKTVPLPDGSSVVLEPLTQVEVAADYHKKNRSVNLAYGEATFNVIHDANIPFSVKLGDAAVHDLGTSFVIRRMEDSIMVKVTSGKVAFVNDKSDESAQLSAGMVLHFSTKDNNTGKIISIDSTAAASLRFAGMPLPQVLTVLQLHFGKKIVMEDAGLAALRFTADVQGQAFELVLDVLCRSLRLQYRQEGDIYYLRQKK